MSEYKGEAGTIYTSEATNVGEDDPPWEVWLENFCILGIGHSELEALQDAERHVVNIGSLVKEAIVKCS